jgi:hypothetical protein
LADIFLHNGQLRRLCLGANYAKSLAQWTTAALSEN